MNTVTVPSDTHDDATWVPLLMNVALRTDCSWPSNVFMQVQLPTAHSLRKPSLELVSTHYVHNSPSALAPLGHWHTWSTGEKHALHTPLRWPLRTPYNVPSGCHIWETTGQFHYLVLPCATLAVLSCEPVTISLSLGATSMQLMSFNNSYCGILTLTTVTLLCPLKVVVTDTASSCDEPITR